MTEDSIYAALAAAQAEFPVITKNCELIIGFKSGGRKYQYADLGQILSCVRPALNKHGIFLYQKVRVEDQFVMAETFLSYKTGETISSGEFGVCYANGGNNIAQNIGAARTYACRYSLSSFLGVAADDDLDASELEGNSQTPPPSPPPQRRAPVQPSPVPARQEPPKKESLPMAKQVKVDELLEAIPFVQDMNELKSIGAKIGELELPNDCEEYKRLRAKYARRLSELKE
nr:MAG TPA: ERF superfamily protein [Caudoviricetes sp.]